MTYVPELFYFYRDGQPFHIHTDRTVFERWMKDDAWLYPADRCEIVRYVMAEDGDMAAIKREHFDALKAREVVLLVKHDYGWQVEHWLPDGVAPTSGYDTPQEAAARALQLLDLKEPITPQDWPEIAQIGGPPSPPPRPERSSR